MKRTFFILIISILIGVIPSNAAFGAKNNVPYLDSEYKFLQPFIRVMAVDDTYLWAWGFYFILTSSDCHFLVSLL